MKIDDKNDITFCSTVKDEMLRTMGYSKPELIKVKPFQDNNIVCMCAFDLADGTLTVGKLPNIITKEQKIALIRHELDHFDKAAKIYKSVGHDSYVSALKKRYPGANVDKNFWEKMSQDSNVENFNVERFLDAWNNTKFFTVKSQYDYNCIRNAHLYATEPLEESAYAIQKKILHALGQNDIVLADACGKPLKNIISHLDKMGISDEEKIKIYMELCDAAFYKKFSKNTLLLMKNYSEIKAGTPNDEVRKLIQELPQYADSVNTYQMVKMVENWLSQHCYSIDNILEKGLV